MTTGEAGRRRPGKVTSKPDPVKMASPPPTQEAETEREIGPADHLERMNANLAKVEELTQRMVAALSRRKPADPGLGGPSGDLFFRAATGYMTEMVQNPGRILEHQIGYWGKALKHYVDAQHALTSGRFAPAPDNTPRDRRFSNPLWDTHPFFNYVKQQYLISVEAAQQAVADMQLEENERRRIDFFTRQMLDLLSPTNFFGTNPDALEKAVATDGQSLVQGLENLVADLEGNDGELLVTLADKRAFQVGENIAATEGAVVYRNRLFELIQYTPRTDTVRALPLLIFPPWINKYYILDLKPQNSFIRWVVDQGYTVFVVSWINPDATYAEAGLDTYIEEGFLKAIETVREITGEEQINAVGYCIAGTTLALTLALMRKRGLKSIRSASFLTTLTDFADQGEFTAFLSDDFVDAIEREAKGKGYLAAFFMAKTFSFLRANDLVYGPAIRSYMMGEARPAFDLLYWNGDSTNLPARMAVEYLRWLCQQNRFADGGIDLCGEKLTLEDVQIPLCAVACETDHIAAWKSSFAGIAKMGSSDKTFLLAESGHVAGVISPPGKDKYGHYTGPMPEGPADVWREAAKRHGGSWWPHWESWLRGRSGEETPARAPGAGNHPVLGDAPGGYVLIQAETP